jgi:hypothetical protein
MWIVRQQICLCSEGYNDTSGVLYFESMPKDFYQYEEFALVSFLLIKTKFNEYSTYRAKNLPIKCLLFA